MPVDLSIIEYDLDRGEEIFLTYTWERITGPNLVRAGDSPPEIQVIDRPGTTTISEFGIRLGTWFIQEKLVAEELSDVEAQIAGLGEGAAAEDLELLDQMRAELCSIDRELRESKQTGESPAHVRAHDRAFAVTYPDYRIIGQQGCANLTLHYWCVAYINNRLAADGADESPHILVSLPQEKLKQRIYSCLIKWKPFEEGVGRVTIEDIKFSMRSDLEDPNGMAEVQFYDRWLPRGDSIEFAVSGQQVIRDSEIVPIATVCHQFEDLRHLIQMPNLNPDCPLYENEPTRGGQYRPRFYFRKDQTGDIWLGEASLRADQNLLRAALSGPVMLEIPPLENQERLAGAMRLAGYKQADSSKPLSPGQWRYVGSDHGGELLEVHFKRNTYSWTMIGLSSDNRRLLSLACTGIAGKSGHTVEEAAKLLLDAGAVNALLIDQGKNVFQKVDRGDGVLDDAVPCPRRRLRATLIFAVPQCMAASTSEE